MQFQRHRSSWLAKIQLSAWTNFIDDDTIGVLFAPEGRDDAPLTAEEIALAAWLPAHHEMQKQALLSAVLSAYPQFREDYFKDHRIDENEDDLPLISSIDGLSKVLSLDAIYVHQISKDGAPYVGYGFACAWEQEHAFGVLMHKDRVVEMGWAETAFLLWIAEDDALNDT